MFRNIVWSLFLIGVASKCLVEGLQCYVCEDCNEYEDFKELHICGEIPMETTREPVSLPEQLTEAVSKKPLDGSTMKPSKKPSIPNDYLDSEETHDEVKPQNANQTIPQNTTLEVKPTSSEPTKVENQKPSTDNQKPINQPSSTETSTTTTLTTTESKTTTSTTSSVAVISTTKAKPDLAIDYDDYLEYEDPVARSLLKINEPVCYMVKYQVNNTVITNRGCTSFINANKYLTCQSLYNGAPMESCRICSSNGCNKFLTDDGDDGDDHGLPTLNAVGTLGHLSFVVLLMGVLINHFVI